MCLLSYFLPLISSLLPYVSINGQSLFPPLMTVFNCTFREMLKPHANANLLRSTHYQTRSSMFSCYPVFRSFSEISNIYCGKNVSYVGPAKWRTISRNHIAFPSLCHTTDEAGRPYQTGYQNHSIILAWRDPQRSPGPASTQSGADFHVSACVVGSSYLQDLPHELHSSCICTWMLLPGFVLVSSYSWILGFFFFLLSSSLYFTVYQGWGPFLP